MKNRHNKRAWWHDYHSRSIYLITINKKNYAPSFGELSGDWRIPVGSPNSPYIVYSELGKSILRVIKGIPSLIPNTDLMQYIIMPDHIHFLIFIKERTPLHLGKYISAFKNELRLKVGFSAFQAGFNDKILSINRKLDDIYRYIRENPYRLAIKKANPDNFRRCDCIRIQGKLYTGYGNLFLLKNPFRDAVIIHKRYTDEERDELQKKWLHRSYSGGVLVSPFIAQGEKRIREEIEKFGGRVILIVDKPLPPPPYKPAYRDFYRCANGELLILAPFEEDKIDCSLEAVNESRKRRASILEGLKKPDKKKKVSRDACLDMNALAEYICSDKFNSPKKEIESNRAEGSHT